MTKVYPFRPLQYKNGTGDVGHFIAPPYDVLDAKGKERLLAKDIHNVVGIDLPHTPAKELGPAETYAAAGNTFRKWISSGTLARRGQNAIFAYRQTFTYNGKQHQRCGMTCCIEVLPFGPRAGGGVLPHEETFSGPKEDRMALMKATRAQLSPIFGLHTDAKGDATTLTRSVMASRKPDLHGILESDGVLHEVWTIDDATTIAAYQNALENEDIFIADGHHRYTTGLSYLKQLESEGQIPADHPARRSMFVLIGMSDPGLVIGPTHRVLGGMANYSIEKFLQASSSHLRCEAVGNDIHQLEQALNRVSGMGENRLGIYDFATGQCFLAIPARTDPLMDRFPSKPHAWRTLDVALIQYLIVEQICQPALNAGQPVKWAFPHSVPEVVEIGRGAETGAGGGKGFVPQLAVIVRPTPLPSVRAVSQANELMPQKSTFFYPKLATGLFVNVLE